MALPGRPSTGISVYIVERKHLAHTVPVGLSLAFLLPYSIAVVRDKWFGSQKGVHMKSIMKYFGILALAGLSLALVPAASAQRVAVGVGVGPVAVGVGPAYVGEAPACAYGYYSYYPYACAPYGYYGPSWFNGGIFIGAGPWFHGGFYGRPGFYGRGGFYGRPGWGGRGPGFVGRPVAGGVFHGPVGRTSPVARGSVGGGFRGGAVSHGAAGGGFHGGGASHGGGGHR